MLELTNLRYKTFGKFTKGQLSSLKMFWVKLSAWAKNCEFYKLCQKVNLFLSLREVTWPTSQFMNLRSNVDHHEGISATNFQAYYANEFIWKLIGQKFAFLLHTNHPLKTWKGFFNLTWLIWPQLWQVL